jgi:hypothetical protein
MDISPRHQEAETRFRQLLEEGGIEPPDSVEYGSECVRFFWSAQKLVVVVDLDDAEAPVITSDR